MSRDPDWTLLGRFLCGDATAEEATLVERWAAGDAANARTLAFMREVWTEAGSTPTTIDEDAGWQAVQRTMETTPAVRPFHVTPTQPERRFRGWLRAGLAAAAVLVAVAGSLIWREYRPGTPVESAWAGRVYATTPGQRAVVTLVDGTRVWLNADSRLQLLPGYGADARDVALEGEAYFVVHDDEDRPFRVLTRDAISEDLGTEFSVRAYAEDPAVVVIVASGRVAMRRAGDSTAPDADVELTEGQMGRLGRTGRVAVTDDVDLAALLGWRKGWLELDQRPLREVLRELERWYDLDIALEDSSVARAPITASLGRHTADEALAIIAGVVDLQYTRDGRQVRLFAKVPPR